MSAFSPALLLRSIAGLVLGSMAGAALTDLGGMIIALAVSGFEPSSNQSLAALLAGGFGFGAMRGAFLVLPVAALAGWPLHLALMRVGWRGILVYGLAGATLMLGAYFIALYCMGAASISWLVLTPLSTGLIVGIVFWLIRRPDRD